MDTDGNLVSMKVPKDAPVEVNVDDTPVSILIFERTLMWYKFLIIILILEY